MKLKFGTIYKAINKINKKSYIGKTFGNFNKYKQLHLGRALKGNKKYFYFAIRKYGFENFEWKILFQNYCNDNKLDSLEIFFITYYNTFGKHGYNLTKGGDGWASGQANPCSKLNMSKEKRIKKAKKTHKTAKERGTDKLRILNMLKTRKNWSKKDKEKFSNNMSKAQMGIQAGSKNPRAKKFLLIAPNGQKIGAFGTLNKICEKYNLNFATIRSRIDKGKIFYKNINKVKNIKSINSINWQTISI